MPAQFTLLYKGQSHEIDITSLYVASQFEEKYDRSFQCMANASEMRVGWLAFCVWRAAAHQGITVPLKFDDFLQNDPLIEAIEDAEEENTNPTPGEQ